VEMAAGSFRRREPTALAVLTAVGALLAAGCGSGGSSGSTPTHLSLPTAPEISAGERFSVELEPDGTVLAWGNNATGQLGDGNAPIDHATPAAVHGLGRGSGVVQIEAGKSFALVREANGAVLAWGNGTSGQLGDGANDKRSAPTPV